jgi:pimeloyl-ACP methyl ester carboxylesterase
MSGLAEDLQPYFAMDMYYDVIIGHSLGGTVALSLLPFLPKEKENTVILVDPPLEVPDERLPMDKIWFLNEVDSAKTVEELMAQIPIWSRTSCLLRMLGLSMCDRTAVESIFQVHSQL